MTKTITDGKIQVVVEISNGGYSEQFAAKTETGKFDTVVSSAGGSGGPVCLRVITTPNKTASAFAPLTAGEITLAGNQLTVRFFGNGITLVRTIMLEGAENRVRITTRLEPSRPIGINGFYDAFRFDHQPDWTFSPSLGGFNPDAQYKAPLILAQSGPIAFGLIPDMSMLSREILKQCSHAIDLDVPAGPVLSVGFMPCTMTYHSVYGPDLEKGWPVSTPVENAYYAMITAHAEPGQAYRDCVRFHWKTFGRTRQPHAAIQQCGTDGYGTMALFDDWRLRTWDDEALNSWVSIPLSDNSKGGGPATSRALGARSVYLSSWFNSIRTAYGMALYARRSKKDDLLALTAQTVNLVLKAPGHKGAFKCIAALDENNLAVWGAGDGSGGSTIDGYLAYDMSWTAYWLLRWYQALLPGSDGIVSKCRSLARFLIDAQEPDGMFFTFFDETGQPIKERAPFLIAETGPVALFLLELYGVDRNPDWLAAARKALVFLEKEILPARKWFDFETFWSCSPKKTIEFDSRSAQWPANNLALSQTVGAWLQAYRVTGEKRYLDIGEQTLDYLLLGQQCWTNPTLEKLTGPDMLMGGFTTQNSDAEWSDARQSQCGTILLDYFRATGKREYLERGIAALRAQFPVSPSENWAHSGYGEKAGVSSFHWGTGSGMAGIEIDHEFFRDAIIDVAGGTGVGVNGLNVVKCDVDADAVTVTIESPFAWNRKPVVSFYGAAPEKTYSLKVNNRRVGIFNGSALGNGVEIDL